MNSLILVFLILWLEEYQWEAWHCHFAPTTQYLGISKCQYL